MSTFHRFCARLLRSTLRRSAWPRTTRSTTSTTASGRCKRVLEDADLETGARHARPRIASAISWAKNNLITPDEYQATPGNPLGGSRRRVYPAYQAACSGPTRSISTTCCCTSPTLLKENPEIRRTLDDRYRYILVDEYQDTNLAQYAIVRALSIDHPNLAVTGDPDQSIYGWRGANLSNILEFEHDFPQVTVVRLEQNYRSTKASSAWPTR